jgi:molybdenum cofactor guanylyltransferase
MLRPVRLFSDTTGALVAGGRATRMGGLVKGLLLLDGEPIAARTLRLFRTVFADALVVANDPAPWVPLGAAIVPDALPGKGAPGGLHAALAAARTDWVFAAGCDMPFVSEAGIAYLADRRADAEAVIVRFDGHLQPLHAFWSRRALPTIERLLREGNPSFPRLAAALNAHVVEEDAWRAFDPDGRAFENANTPADAARLGLLRPTQDDPSTSSG